MTFRTLALAAFAILVAGATAVYAHNWLNTERSRTVTPVALEAPPPLKSKTILVARKALPAGTFVKPDFLEWRPWPEDGVIDGYITKESGKIEDFNGAVVRNAIAAGQPVTTARVVHPGTRGFLAAVLKPGLRAVSVPVNATTGISGFIFPGDWIDLLLTMRVKSEDDEGKSRTRYFSQTLLTRLRVLAIDQTVENTDGKASVGKTATLQVSPKQAERIAIALNMGDLSLSLRSLARDQDDNLLAPKAAELNAVGLKATEPKAKRKRKPTRSYTLDMDVYNMGRDPRLFGRRRTSRPAVTVMRGDKTNTAKF